LNLTLLLWNAEPCDWAQRIVAPPSTLHPSHALNRSLLLDRALSCKS
jgi:hypothetical protein